MKKLNKKLLTLFTIMGIGLALSVYGFMGYITESETRLQTIAQQTEIQHTLKKQNDKIRHEIKTLTGDIVRLEMDLKQKKAELLILTTKRNINSAEWNTRQDIINRNNARIDEIVNFPMDQ